MSPIVSQYSHRAMSAKTHADFQNILKIITSYLGMDGYTFFHQNAQGQVFTIDSRPKTFLDYYHNKEWTFLDPVVRTALAMQSPFLWSKDVKARTPTQKIILNTGADFGICDGLNFPIWDTDALSGLSFYSKTIKGSTASVFKEEKTNIDIFAKLFHLSFKKYLEKSDSPFGNRHLTERECEILFLLTMGDSNPEISEKLNISTETVKSHVSNIIKKLGSRNRTHAAAIATRNKITL